MRVTQRSVMQELLLRHDGDYERVIRDYIRAEQEGRVPRKSTGMGAAEYADRLWRDGIGKGWLGAAGQASSPPSPGKAKQTSPLPSFDTALREMG